MTRPVLVSRDEAVDLIAFGVAGEPDPDSVSYETRQMVDRDGVTMRDSAGKFRPRRQQALKLVSR